MRRLAIVTAAAAIFAGHAAAQPAACFPRASVLAKLANDYGEDRVSIGIHKNGAVLETFANRETGTWTLVMTPPGAPVSCIVGVGTDWQAIDDEPQDPET